MYSQIYFAKLKKNRKILLPIYYINFLNLLHLTRVLNLKIKIYYGEMARNIDLEFSMNLHMSLTI